MLDDGRDLVSVAHLQVQIELCELLELEQPDEPHGGRRVRVHDHGQLVCVWLLNAAIRQLDKHRQILREGASQTQAVPHSIILGRVDPSQLNSGALTRKRIA